VARGTRSDLIKLCRLAIFLKCEFPRMHNRGPNVVNELFLDECWQS